MRFRAILLPLCVAQLVAGAAVTQERQLNENAILQELLEVPNLLPRSSRMLLAERTKNRRQKRQNANQSATTIAILGSLISTLTNWNVKPPASKVAEVQDSQSPFWPEAKRRKVRYGPYRIPPVSEKTLESQLLNVQGLTNTMKVGGKKPCDGECVLLNLVPGLEYDDGKVAESYNGAWLHHAVLLNAGLQVNDAVCGGGMIEHLFESGNERTEIAFVLPNSTVKSGYHIRPSDIFLINTELMNMDNQEKWVWLTLTFDYIDGTPPGYKEGKVVWMSIGPSRCGGTDSNPFGKSNLTASQQPTAVSFSEYSLPWVSPRDGYILGANAHMHEGGVSVDVFRNDQLICTSLPKYAKSAAKGMGGHHGKRQNMGGHSSDDIEHIGEQTGCEFHQAIPIKKGDRMYIRSNYDFSQHPGMLNKKGELDEVMGIVGSLVAFDYPFRYK